MISLAPLKAIPAPYAQEQLSVAYVSAICAQAGLNILKASWDDGVDMHVGTTKSLKPAIPRNFFLAVQLKSTCHFTVVNGVLRYFLSRKAYIDLSETSVCPQYLFLYVIPHSRLKWVSSQPIVNDVKSAYITMRHCAFYLRFPQNPPRQPRRSGLTVSIPFANRLTAASLRHLYLREADALRSTR